MTHTPMDAASIETALNQQLPGMEGYALRVTAAQPHQASLHLPFAPSQIRPGGTLSGPTMMTLADAAMYAAILATVGPEWLAVTTDLTIHFLRRPAPGDLLADARILKLGKTLIVIQVDIRSVDDTLVAHVVGTYARPPASMAAA